MTFSILAFDRKTGTFAAAAATGSLCVGGWVLRGDVESGLVASQGTAPSTFWRDTALRAMGEGDSATQAVERVTAPDTGRAHRQLAALDRDGGTAAFTGADSVAFAGHVLRGDLVVAGNMLSGKAVLDALADGYLAHVGEAPDRLLAGLFAAEAAGGDARGLLSAALLVLRPDAPPLDLRIDHATDPLSALRSLLAAARAQPYAGWLGVVPVAQDRFRAPGPPEAAE